MNARWLQNENWQFHVAWVKPRGPRLTFNSLAAKVTGSDSQSKEQTKGDSHRAASASSESGANRVLFCLQMSSLRQQNKRRST